MTWELNLGKPSRPRQRYYTSEELKAIIEAAPAGQYRTLFALFAGTGVRFGKAAGLSLRTLISSTTSESRHLAQGPTLAANSLCR